MSEAASAAAPAAATAGALLRAARERSGLHIAALAASLKVPVRKLEALEADRYAELTDATFVRTLALSVCRQLRADPAPILLLLPDPTDPLLRTHARLARVHMPPRDDFVSVASPLRWLRRPLFWLVSALLAAALALLLWPQSAAVMTTPAAPPAEAVPSAPLAPPSEPAASAPALTAEAPVSPGAPVLPSSPVLASIPATPAATPAATSVPPAPSTASVPATASAPPVATGPALLRLRASGTAWVEVLDAGGAVVQRGNLQPGESVVADGRTPLKVTIGRADRVEVQVRGQAFDAAAQARDNVARFEVK